MELFDLAHAFIEGCETPQSTSQLAAAFQQTIDVLGFRFFACCSHVDPLHPPRRTVMLLNYPDAWVRSYSEGELHQIDPVFQRAERALTPFSWDSAEFRRMLSTPQQQVLAHATSHGVSHGFTIPIHAPGALGTVHASCTVIPDDRLIDPRSYHLVQLMAVHLYESALRAGDTPLAQPCASGFSRRERQCLELAAQGKTDWEIGVLLGIAERTVHNHIEHAKRRLGVTTRVQAIMEAVDTQQLALGDVVPRRHRVMRH